MIATCTEYPWQLVHLNCKGHFKDQEDRTSKCVQFQEWLEHSSEMCRKGLCAPCISSLISFTSCVSACVHVLYNPHVVQVTCTISRWVTPLCNLRMAQNSDATENLKTVHKFLAGVEHHTAPMQGCSQPHPHYLLMNKCVKPQLHLRLIISATHCM